MIRRLAAPLALVALAMPAVAQENPTPVASTPDVVVEGQLKKKELHNVLKDVLEESGREQFGRFEEKVCPGVTGAPAGTAETILALIRANATAAKLRLEEPGCKPNAVVMFVAEPAKLVAGLKARKPGWFALVPKDRIARLMVAGDPIRSWHVTETFGKDGEMLANFDGIGESGRPTDAPASGNAKVVKNASATRTYENVRQEMLMAFAVIDNDVVVGKTLQQLADIASMHLFLDLAPDAGGRAGRASILALFEPGDGARATELSALDRGMLAGLYTPSRNNYDSQVQRYRIAKEVKRQQEK